MIEYKVTVDGDGVERWRLNDLKHRENGPAVTYPSGARYHYRFGKLHNDKGPAAIQSNGDEYYYLNGVRVTKEEVMNPQTCAGKEVMIDGKRYRLEEVSEQTIGG